MRRTRRDLRYEGKVIWNMFQVNLVSALNLRQKRNNSIHATPPRTYRMGGCAPYGDNLALSFGGPTNNCEVARSMVWRETFISHMKGDLSPMYGVLDTYLLHMVSTRLKVKVYRFLLGERLRVHSRLKAVYIWVFRVYLSWWFDRLEEDRIPVIIIPILQFRFLHSLHSVLCSYLALCKNYTINHGILIKTCNITSLFY